MQWPVVKICGVTSVEQAEMVASAGATAIGLVLDESRRQVSVHVAREIADALRGRVDVFCVFRGSGLSRILTAANDVRPDVVQMHGSETLDEVREVARAGFLVVKALEATDPSAAQFDVEGVAGILLDGSEPGSGKRVDFSPLHRLAWRAPLIAAGGLSPATVSEVIGGCPINGVDVSSGVESAPGVKDPALVAEFIRIARDAFNRRETRDVQWT